MQKVSKPTQPIWARTPKYVYGAIAGLLIGLAAILAVPAIAAYILVAMVVIAAYVFILTRQSNAQAGRQNGSWSPRKLSAAPIFGALVIGVVSIAGVQYLGMSFAWHPQGAIKKSVQNVTTNGQAADANDPNSAITAKPGDILNYIIVVSNVAPPASNHYNDLGFTVMTDTLPAGVELVSDPAKRTITENIGTILPGQSVTKTYQVKVTSTVNGSMVGNKACYTGDSVVKDNPQQGCNLAYTKVQVPITPPAPPAPTPTPTPPAPTPTPPAPTPTPPVPNPATPTPTPTPPAATPTTPTTTPTPPSPTPPATTPPVSTPTPPTVTTPTPPTPTNTSSEQLPNVGPRSIIIIALFAVVAGYLVSALYGYANNGRPKRFE